MLVIHDLYWAAGFLEGEGGFVATTKNSAFTISAVQVQMEPLERLLKIFGGHLKVYTNNHGTIHGRWTVNGSHAVSIAFTIFTLMSPRRKEQIRLMVAGWRSCPGRNNRWKTHCPKGHEYGDRNNCTYNRRRYCVTCYPSYTALIEQKKADKRYERSKEVVH